MNEYPVIIRLHGKKVVVIGGGKVAERKTATLLEAKADVSVISPSITETMKEWFHEGMLKWSMKVFEPSCSLHVPNNTRSEMRGSNSYVTRNCPKKQGNWGDQKDGQFKRAHPCLYRRG